MAYTFAVNQTPLTGTHMMYTYYATLKAAGWTSGGDSDGTTYSAGGTQVTGANTGTNGLQNTNAWFVIKDPAGKRSFCWQRGSSNLLWRMKYSKSAGFTGGSPSATRVPSATDERVLLGGGTDASPSFTSTFYADNSYRFHFVAGDSSVGYSYYFLTNQIGVGASNSQQIGHMLDVMATGSYSVDDPDPAIVYMDPNLNSRVFGNNSGGIGNQGSQAAHAFWMNAGTLTWDYANTMTVYDYYSNRHLAGFAPDNTVAGFGQNSNNGKETAIPLIWGKSIGAGAPAGFKGFSAMLYYCASRWMSNFDTVTISTTKDRMYFNGTLLPWDGSDPVI